MKVITRKYKLEKWKKTIITNQMTREIIDYCYQYYIIVLSANDKGFYFTKKTEYIEKLDT